MRRIILAIAVMLAVLLLMVHVSGRSSDLFRVRDGRTVPFGAMVDDTAGSDIIVVGEIHGVPQHHATELQVIRTLHEADTPLFIAMEMFRADSQKDLDAWTSGATTLERFLPVYYRNWRMPWPLYEDILLYAREHKIPLIGLNIPDRVADAVARRGFSALTDEERRQVPQGVSCTVDTRYMAFIRKAYIDHGIRDEQSFRYFCEAQMLWDKSMAVHLVAALKAHPGKKAVVIAGVGHAWRRGIPEQVSLISKYRLMVILPAIPGQTAPGSVTLDDTDYLVLR